MKSLATWLTIGALLGALREADRKHCAQAAANAGQCVIRQTGDPLRDLPISEGIVAMFGAELTDERLAEVLEAWA